MKKNIQPTLPPPSVIPAEWTDDCQGKKDYDGTIIKLNSRYWPSVDYTLSGGNCTKPSAQSCIAIYWNDNPEDKEYDPRYIDVIKQDFEGETEAEVKLKVEIWAKSQYDKITSAIVDLYNNEIKSKL